MDHGSRSRLKVQNQCYKAHGQGPRSKRGGPRIKAAGSGEREGWSCRERDRTSRRLCARQANADVQQGQASPCGPESPVGPARALPSVAAPATSLRQPRRAGRASPNAAAGSWACLQGGMGVAHRPPRQGPGGLRSRQLRLSGLPSREAQARTPMATVPRPLARPPGGRGLTVVLGAPYRIALAGLPKPLPRHRRAADPRRPRGQGRPRARVCSKGGSAQALRGPHRHALGMHADFNFNADYDFNFHAGYACSSNALGTGTRLARRQASTSTPTTTSTSTPTTPATPTHLAQARAWHADRLQLQRRLRLQLQRQLRLQPQRTWHRHALGAQNDFNFNTDYDFSFNDDYASNSNALGTGTRLACRPASTSTPTTASTSTPTTPSTPTHLAQACTWHADRLQHQRRLRLQLQRRLRLQLQRTWHRHALGMQADFNFNFIAGYAL